MPDILPVDPMTYRARRFIALLERRQSSFDGRKPDFNDSALSQKG